MHVSKKQHRRRRRRAEQRTNRKTSCRTFRSLGLVAAVLAPFASVWVALGMWRCVGRFFRDPVSGHLPRLLDGANQTCSAVAAAAAAGSVLR